VDVLIKQLLHHSKVEIYKVKKIGYFKKCTHCPKGPGCSRKMFAALFSTVWTDVLCASLTFNACVQSAQYWNCWEGLTRKTDSSALAKINCWSISYQMCYFLPSVHILRCYLFALFWHRMHIMFCL
jgi:hypothetical protein